MSKISFQDMMLGLNDLTVEQLSQLNKQLLTLHKAKSTIARQAVATSAIVGGKFQVGDIIEFYKAGRARTSGYNYFKFDHMNRKGDCMQGPPCTADGKIIPGMGNWTVGITQPTLKVVFRNGKPFKAE